MNQDPDKIASPIKAFRHHQTAMMHLKEGGLAMATGIANAMAMEVILYAKPPETSS